MPGPLLLPALFRFRLGVMQSRAPGASALATALGSTMDWATFTVALAVQPFTSFVTVRVYTPGAFTIQLFSVVAPETIPGPAHWYEKSGPVLLPCPLSVTVPGTQVIGPGAAAIAVGGVIFWVTVAEAVAVQPLMLWVTVSV